MNFLRPAQRGPGEQVLLVLLDLAYDVLVLGVHLDYNTINLSIRTSPRPVHGPTLHNFGASTSLGWASR